MTQDDAPIVIVRYLTIREVEAIAGLLQGGPDEVVQPIMKKLARGMDEAHDLMRALSIIVKAPSEKVKSRIAVPD